MFYDVHESLYLTNNTVFTVFFSHVQKVSETKLLLQRRGHRSCEEKVHIFLFQISRQISPVQKRVTVLSGQHVCPQSVNALTTLPKTPLQSSAVRYKLKYKGELESEKEKRYRKKARN